MHPPRLSRLPQLFTRNPIYFLTLCTFDRKMLLARDNVQRDFVDFCQKSAGHGLSVGKYVLMPDHLHLFVKPAAGGISLSDWVKSLKNRLSKSWRAMGEPAPHWQKGFFDHVLRTQASYEEKQDYVFANPVRAGLAPSTMSWPYQGRIEDLGSLRRS